MNNQLSSWNQRSVQNLLGPRLCLGPHWNHRSVHYALLSMVGAFLCLVNLGGPSLWDRDEGRNAGAALEMMESQDWVVPKFNAQLRVDKPALLYWLQIGAYRLFGITEFAARLPSALAALLTMLAAYELGRRLFNPATGLLGALVVVSTPMFCAAARFANPDALLHLFTVLVLLLFWLGYERGRLCFVSMGVAAGLAVLAKGPVGLVLPAAVIGVFLAWNRQLQLLCRGRLFLGWLAFLLVALPWYVWVAVDTKANFLRGFLLNHNVDRFLNPMENHRGAYWYYLVVLVVGFAPWSVFLGWALWHGLRGTVWKAATSPAALPEHLPHRFLCCWLAVYLVFFSLAATKLPNYVLPVTVPLALWTAWFCERWQRQLLPTPAWCWHLSLTLLVLIGVMTSLGVLLASGTWQSAWLRGRHLPELQTWALAGLWPVLGASLAWWRLRQGDRAGTILSVAATAVLFLGPLAAWAVPLFNHFKAPRPLVEQAGARQLQQDLRIGCWQLEHLPSLNFYCQRHVMHHNTEDEVLTFLRYPLPVFLFTPARLWHQLEPQVPVTCRVLARHRDMYSGDEVVVIGND